MLTRKRLVNQLRKRWAKEGVRFTAKKRPGISIEELVRHSRKRNASVTTPYLDLWLVAFDEFISWQVSLLAALYTSRKNDELSAFEKSIVVILSKIICDSIAIRHAILAGYDIAANIILRSTIEYMELYVAIINDPLLANEFVKTDDPELASAFWRKHIARSSIKVRMKQAWSKFFDAAESEAASWFASRGAHSKKLLAGLSHPSFAGGMFSLIPMKTKHTEENWLGLWGDRSEGSVQTISTYSIFMLPMLLLDSDFPFEGFDSYLSKPLVFNDKDEFHTHTKLGRSILASLIMMLSNEENDQDVYPSFDYSIFRE